ncbi:MAG: hypothetical protein RTU92_12545 [Candidatus Thorarchaeota archaeon]
MLKIALLGSPGVGKTDLTPWGRFESSYDMTIGMEPAVYSTVSPSHGIRVKLQIWEINPGQRFESVRTIFFKGSMGGILVWDVTNRESFEAIEGWWTKLKSNVGDVPILCVANKTDLRGKRVVSTDEGILFANERGFDYVESGAGGRADFEMSLVDLAEKAYEWKQENP